MRAFLCHSSRDKGVVDTVFKRLGSAQTVYDSESFDAAGRSSEQIARALASVDVFVLFWSHNAATSAWVGSECRLAIERLFDGSIRSLMVFTLDDTPVPEAIATAFRGHKLIRTDKPAQIARRIRAEMIELELEQASGGDIFVGRGTEFRDLQRAMALPQEEMRPVISIAGWKGIGRKTLVERVVRATFPRLRPNQPAITVDPNDSIIDFHRKLYDAAIGMPKTSAEWLHAGQRFATAGQGARISMLHELLGQIEANKEILIIIGNDGLVQETGDFHSYLEELIATLTPTPRPRLILIHRRKIAPSRQERYPKVAFFALGPLTDDEASELLSAHLKQRDVPYQRRDLEDLLHFVGGHPDNIRLAADYARQYGLEQLRREKADFIDILVFRNIEAMKRIKMSALMKRIHLALIDYRYLDIDDLVVLLDDAPDAAILGELRQAEDNGILQRIGRYYRIAPYLVDAVARTELGSGDADWRAQSGRKMLQRLKEASESEALSLSLINSAALAAIRAKDRSASVAKWVVPSQLLMVAREEYDRTAYESVIPLCRQVVAHRQNVTDDVLVEAHRLLAISLLRTKKVQEFEDSLAALGQMRGKTAKRHVYFLTGLRARYEGRIDDAEESYRKAYQLGRGNFHVLRELADVLAKQHRFAEAESYARAAYGIAPSNPHIIDKLCEVLIGRLTNAELPRNDELRRLLRELERIGTMSARTFYAERMAQYHHRLRDPDAAWRCACDAVDRSPRHHGPRVTRTAIALSTGRFEHMAEDIKALSSPGDEGGHANRFVIDRVRILYAIKRGSLVEARRYLDEAHSMPKHLRAELRKRLDGRGAGDTIGRLGVNNSKSDDVGRPPRKPRPGR